MLLRTINCFHLLTTETFLIQPKEHIQINFKVAVYKLQHIFSQFQFCQSTFLLFIISGAMIRSLSISSFALVHVGILYSKVGSSKYLIKRQPVCFFSLKLRKSYYYLHTGTEVTSCNSNHSDKLKWFLEDKQFENIAFSSQQAISCFNWVFIGLHVFKLFSFQ